MISNNKYIKRKLIRVLQNKYCPAGTAEVDFDRPGTQAHPS